MEHPLKILLLEDNPSDVLTLQRLLKKEGLLFECRVTSNKEEYIRALGEFDADIIISDNTLPGFNATEALEIYHAQSLSIPFILVTGTVSEEFAAGIIKLGADDYILKDRLARLPTAIESALRQRKAEREKQEVIEKLKLSEKNLSTIFENTTEGFILTDKDCIIRAFNENAKKYTRFHTPTLLYVGGNLYDFIEPSRTAYVKELINKVLQGEKIQYDRQYDKNDSGIWLNYSMSPVYENGVISGTCITARDITERKNAEYRQLNEQKKISRAILKAQETERTHIGQELHDNINQILVVIKIYLNKARNDHAILEDSLNYPIELIDITIEEIRSLCKNLVTHFSSNLEEQVQSLLDSLHTQLGIQTSMEYDVKHIIDDDQKLNIYRIFQEQFNNIIRHAQAKQVNVELKSDGKLVTIMITDDGKGFDLNLQRKGIGLTNMINRVELFYGKVVIITAPGKGCIMQISMPLQTEENG